MIIEDYPFVDAIYMTIITVSTVGFGEVHELSEAGRIFTIALIIFSFGTFAYAITALTTHIISGEFQRYFKDYRVNKTIHHLKGHVIVCGYGRNGERAVEELREHDREFVIVEKSEEIIQRLRVDQNYLFVEGDAMMDEFLIEAEIKNASALITTMPEDSDNLYIVLTARALNEDLYIVSRASSDEADSKLRMAGANNVIMPDKIGGAYMASLVLKPDVMGFLNKIITQSADPTNIEEISCDLLPNKLKSKPIGELKKVMKSGASIIGFKTKENEFVVNPSDDTHLDPGAKLFILGTKAQLAQFMMLF